jgi:hypothetical protein
MGFDRSSSISRRRLSALVLALALTAAIVPAAGAAPGHVATVRPAAVAGHGATAAAGPAASLWLWLERLVGRALNLPIKPPPSLDSGGCVDPNGNCT